MDDYNTLQNKYNRLGNEYKILENISDILMFATVEMVIGIRRWDYGDGHSDVGYSRGGTLAAADDCVFEEIIVIFNSICGEPDAGTPQRARLWLPTGPVSA